MAEGTNEDSGSWESWLGGWMQVAKEKSNTALEFVKKDLAEFSTTLQKETEKAIEKTSSSLTRENTEQATTKVKAGISSFLSNVSKALVIPPADEYVPVTVSADGSTFYDRGKARLHAIQLDASTYVDPPQGSSEQFEMWLNSFDMDLHKGEISEILVSKVEVRALYTKLVPNDVSHAEFWQRYFYRVHQMECDEARKQALMQRADRTHGDSLSWDEDDWSGGEDDEGHESDWEKMPKPQQSYSHHPHQQQTPLDQPAKTQTISPPSTPQHTDSCTPSQQQQNIPTDEPQIQNNPPTAIENSIPKCEHPNVSLEVSDSPNPDDASTDSTPASTPRDVIADSSLETVHNHFSADINSHPSSKEVSATEAADPISRLQNIEISADTASACKLPSEPVLFAEDAQGLEPGSPAGVPITMSTRANDLRESVPGHDAHSPTALSAAAASGVVLPPSSTETNSVTGDGAACGASEIQPSPSSSSTTICENNLSANSSTSEASPASTAAPNKETPSSLDVENHECARVQSDTDVVVQQAAEPSSGGSIDLKAENNDNAPDLAMRVKGDMVVVGGTDTLSSDSSEAKDTGLDDDWEEDFDVEVTEEDLKAAEDIARKLGENLDTEDDWENWD